MASSAPTASPRPVLLEERIQSQHGTIYDWHSRGRLVRCNRADIYCRAVAGWRAGWVDRRRAGGPACRCCGTLRAAEARALPLDLRVLVGCHELGWFALYLVSSA
jgi:hypothetical protein